MLLRSSSRIRTTDTGPGLRGRDSEPRRLTRARQGDTSQLITTVLSPRTSRTSVESSNLRTRKVLKTIDLVPRMTSA